MDKISVVIPVKNEADKIERCLDAVFNQTIKTVEVIVVDGHSADQTVENARGEYIAFVDADFIPEKDWLKNLVKEFNREVKRMLNYSGGL